MTQYLTPFSGRQFLDANGNPYVGAKLFAYAAGSSTKVTLTKDSTGSSNHTNPIILNARGEPADGGGSSQAMWQTGGVAVKLVLAPANDTDPPLSAISSWDNLTGINDTTVTIDQWIAGPTPTYVGTTQFTLVGDQTTVFHVGRRVKTLNSGGTKYGTITESTYTSLTTITVALDSGALDSGLSSVQYGLLSAIDNSIPGGTHYAATTFNADIRLNGHLSFVDGYSFTSGRLTLTSATPVTTADVTAATTIYFTPYKGNTISLYDGSSKWDVLTFAELSFSVPATTNQMYDVFAYNNAGVVALEILAWTNDTTRATALVLQNGTYVKSGATTRKYIGSFRTTGVSGQTESSVAKRYLWNYYNRTRVTLIAIQPNTWTYTSATYRQANNNTANQLDLVCGVSEDVIDINIYATSANTSANVIRQIALGIDSTTSPTASVISLNPTSTSSINFLYTLGVKYSGFPSVGRHFYAWLEASTATGTTTWYGDGGIPPIIQSGISGTFFA